MHLLQGQIDRKASLAKRIKPRTATRETLGPSSPDSMKPILGPFPATPSAIGADLRVLGAILLPRHGRRRVQEGENWAIWGAAGFGWCSAACIPRRARFARSRTGGMSPDRGRSAWE